jgi:predicted nucleic acid-binding Zn ribbon protein
MIGKKTDGRLIGQATKPIKMKDQKLYIKCKNPTWKTELQYQKTELIKKINKHTKIKDIILI